MPALPPSSAASSPAHVAKRRLLAVSAPLLIFSAQPCFSAANALELSARDWMLSMQRVQKHVELVFEMLVFGILCEIFGGGRKLAWGCNGARRCFAYNNACSAAHSLFCLPTSCIRRNSQRKCIQWRVSDGFAAINDSAQLAFRWAQCQNNGSHWRVNTAE